MATVQVNGASAFQKLIAKRLADEFGLPNDGLDIKADGGVAATISSLGPAHVEVSLIFRSTAEQIERIFSRPEEERVLTPTEVELEVQGRPTVEQIETFLLTSDVPEEATLTITPRPHGPFSNDKWLIKARWVE